MSGFLSGLNLGSPDERQLVTATKALELERNGWVPPGEGYLYRGGADLVLKHGEFRMGRKLPEKYKQVARLSFTCFANTLEAASQMPELRRCEGYASIGSGAMVAHSWCVAPDGGIVELTWPTEQGWAETNAPNTLVLPPDRWAYYGVFVTPELARHGFEVTGGYGMLGVLQAENALWRKRGQPEQQQGRDTEYPLLKLPYDPERTAL